MITRDHAAALDATDSLRSTRDRFVIDADGPIYMDGNSLGRLPVDAIDVVERVVRDEWGRGLVGSWDRWIDLQQRVGAVIGEIVGAPSGTVTISDSTTVDLYKLAAAAASAFPSRGTIVTDSDNFPTDRYVLDGIAARTGKTVRVIEVDPVEGITPAGVAEALDDDVALVSFSMVAYRSGALADVAGINDLARSVGAMTLWDLSHAVGSVPIDLDSTGTDLAVGCTYKYLNGGPGAPAFLFVRHALQGALRNPIQGWFAHRDQFAMTADFDPAPGIERFLVGTPPIISTSATLPGIAMVADVGVDALRRKSVEATTLLIDLYEERLSPLGIELASPRSADRRGSHVAFTHPHGLGISRWLRSNGGVIVDFRAPDTIRVAVAPLYTTFVEIWDTVEALADATVNERWLEAWGGSVVT